MLIFFFFISWLDRLFNGHGGVSFGLFVISCRFFSLYCLFAIHGWAPTFNIFLATSTAKFQHPTAKLACMSQCVKLLSKVWLSHYSGVN